MKKLAIFISNAGTGTNLEAILAAIKAKKITAEVVVVISDNPDAPGLIHAKNSNTPIHIFNSKTELLETILTQQFTVDYIVLAGWKKIITDKTLQTFPNKILNMHPGLIPDDFDSMVINPDKTNALWNRGKFTNAAIHHFLETHATYAGSTIHFLSPAFDFGKVLNRCFEKIQPHDTVETLYTRVKQKENLMYVNALEKLCK